MQGPRCLRGQGDTGIVVSASAGETCFLPPQENVKQFLTLLRRSQREAGQWNRGAPRRQGITGIGRGGGHKLRAGAGTIRTAESSQDCPRRVHPSWRHLLLSLQLGESQPPCDLRWTPSQRMGWLGTPPCVPPLFQASAENPSWEVSLQGGDELASPGPAAHT